MKAPYCLSDSGILFKQFKHNLYSIKIPMLLKQSHFVNLKVHLKASNIQEIIQEL